MRIEQVPDVEVYPESTENEMADLLTGFRGDQPEPDEDMYRRMERMHRALAVVIRRTPDAPTRILGHADGRLAIVTGSGIVIEDAR